MNNEGGSIPQVSQSFQVYYNQELLIAIGKKSVDN